MPAKAPLFAKFKAAFSSPVLTQGKAKLSNSAIIGSECEREPWVKRAAWLAHRERTLQYHTDLSVNRQGQVHSLAVESFEQPLQPPSARHDRVATTRPGRMRTLPRRVPEPSMTPQMQRQTQLQEPAAPLRHSEPRMMTSHSSLSQAAAVPPSTLGPDPVQAKAVPMPATAPATAKASASVARQPPSTTCHTTQTPRPESSVAALIKDVIAGSASGVAITFAGHPLDTIKTRLQAQSGSRPLYAGTWDCARATFQQEGLRGLYKGAASPLTLYVIYSSVYYSAYIQARRVLGIADRSQPAPAHKVLMASTATGIATAFVRTPMDLLKTQAQTIVFNTPGATPFKGSLDCAAHIVRTKGGLGLFGGFSPTLIRQVVGASAWFFPYEWLKSRCGDGALAVFVSGGLASWVYWASIYPIDAIKTRLQSAPLDAPKQSWYQCARGMLIYEGPRSFFRGFTACMLRAFPANAAGILAYESVRKRLH
eukprot:m.230875 g.230875  ORF g.230875 m.230875 type:complete len:481 (-) comp17359_c0_seq2:3258-4700(-)